MERYLLFLGCTIPARARNYEVSTRKVAERLGIEFVDTEEFICCGFPLRDSDRFKAYLIGAYNLSVANNRGLNICTLCSSCTSFLSEVQHDLINDPELRERINIELSKIGLKFESPTEIRHFVRILNEDSYIRRIKENIKEGLDSISVSIHYGCHYLRPSHIFGKLEDLESPNTIHRILSCIDCKVLDYEGEKDCCGGPILPVDEKTALGLSGNKLMNIEHAGADALVVVCPFCAVMFDGNQKAIRQEYGLKRDIPVLFLPQLIGLSFGFLPKELGFNLNVIKAKELLSRLSK